MGKSKTPPAPDYAKAAEQTAAGNLEMARYATQANRANQYTPYGSLTWQQGAPTRTFNQSRYDEAVKAAQQMSTPGRQVGGDDGYWEAGTVGGPLPDRNDERFYDMTPSDNWSQTVSFSPEMQALFDQQIKTSQGLAGLQDTAMDRVRQMMGQPFDYSSVQDLADDAYEAQTARLNPEWEQRENQLRARLANQGISMGTEAASNEFRNFDRGRNDAFTNARLSAINTMPQTFQLAQALRNMPLNELNALRTGSQVTNPTFSNYAQQQATAGPNYMGAADAQYGAAVDAANAQNAGLGGMMGGLFSLGSAAMGSPWAGKALFGV